jgi:hypothetical protein
MAGQQRRMIADASQARACKRLLADPRVGMRGHDEFGPVGNRCPGYILRVLQQVDRHIGRFGGERKPVVCRWRNDAPDVGTVGAQNFEHRGPEKPGPDQGASHRATVAALSGAHVSKLATAEQGVGGIFAFRLYRLERKRRRQRRNSRY